MSITMSSSLFFNHYFIFDVLRRHWAVLLFFLIITRFRSDICLESMTGTMSTSWGRDSFIINKNTSLLALIIEVIHDMHDMGENQIITVLSCFLFYLIKIEIFTHYFYSYSVLIFVFLARRKVACQYEPIPGNC